MMTKNILAIQGIEIRQFFSQYFKFFLFSKKKTIFRNRENENKDKLLAMILHLKDENKRLKNELSCKLILLDRNLKLKEIIKSRISDLNIDFLEKKNLMKALKSFENEEVNRMLDTDFFTIQSELISKLTSINKRLTSNNLKLCILVYKKMSTKEISRVLVMTPSSVKVAKFRLKKKLGIVSSKKTLVTFLHSL